MQVDNVEEQFVYIAMSFALLVPVLMFLGGIADTLRRGGKNIGLPPTALLCALLGTLVVFAGASMAAIRAISAFDLAGTVQTSAADAAFDAALLGGLCAALGGVAWWSSKLIGRSFSELGRPLALLLGGGAFVAAVPELIAGFRDQPGGFVPTMDTVKDGVELSNTISAIGICLVALGVLGFIGLLLKSFRGEAAAADPVDGHTLEWATASPPPVGQLRRGRRRGAFRAAAARQQGGAVIAADQMPAAELPRPRTLLVGTVFAIVACGMFFAGAFGIYLKARSDVVTSGGKWLKAGQISLVPGGMMMVTAAMSVVTMTWAVQAIRNDDRKNAYIALGITLLFGVANINQQVFYYHDMKLKVQGSVAELLIYVITGAHVAMLIGAMVFVALAAFRALAGQYSSRQSDGIQAASYFWYATMLMYTLIYYGIYVTK